MKIIILVLMAGLLVSGCTTEHVADPATPAMTEMDIFTAVREERIEAIRALVEKDGKLVKKKEKNGGTALFIAAEQGNLLIVEYLVSRGAEVKIKDNMGWTPLHLAAWGGNKEVVEYLMAKGAEVNAKNNFGKTPLSNAIDAEHKDIEKLLRERGATE